jgi:hypothetical protein
MSIVIARKKEVKTTNAASFAQRQFWSELLAKAQERGFQLHFNQKPTDKYFISVLFPKKPQMEFRYFARIWTSRGSPLQISYATVSFSMVGTTDRDRDVFDYLFLQSRAIEKSCKGLEWRMFRESNKTIFCMEYDLRRRDSFVMGKREWPKLQDHMIDVMWKLMRTITPYISRALWEPNPDRLPPKGKTPITTKSKRSNIIKSSNEKIIKKINI